MSKKPYSDKSGEVRELDQTFFKHAKRGRPTKAEADRKQRVTIMLDKDVIAHFKQDGRGWQSRANAALRKAAGLKKKKA